MAAEPSFNVAQLLREHLQSANPDLLREMVRTFAEVLMSAEADAICDAEYGERSDERVNSRNGYRHVTGTPAPAPSSWPSRSCAPAAISRTGCCSTAAAPSRPSSRWSRQLSARGLDPPGREAGRAARRQAVVQVAGLGDSPAPRRAGQSVPQPAAGRRTLRVLLAGRAGRQGPRARPDR